MKKLVMTLLAAALLAGSLATTAAAIEVTGDAYAGVYSKYIWRGYDLSPEDKFVIQGGADISAGGFTMGWWGNLSENTGELNEVDVVLDYTAELDAASISVGNILYDVDGATDTNELYLGLGLTAPLNPSLTVYWDYEEFETVYTVLGISHDVEVSDTLSLSLGATASYLNMLTGIEEDWFHDAEFSLGASFAVNDQVSVDASFLYTTPLSNDAKTYGGLRGDEYAIGAAATLAF